MNLSKKLIINISHGEFNSIYQIDASRHLFVEKQKYSILIKDEKNKKHLEIKLPVCENSKLIAFVNDITLFEIDDIFHND